jgi:putative two-component system response regulator
MMTGTLEPPLNTADSSQKPDLEPVPSALAVAVFATVTLAGLRGSDTGKHLLRVRHYVKILAQRLQEHPRFTADLTDDYLHRLLQWVPLYDLGTLGIPDRILLKPSSLTPAEFEIIKTHTSLACAALTNAEKILGVQFDDLKIAKELSCSHHEKWDGSGYPQGLAGEKIPLSARLMAFADVYDALISDRVYRAGVPHDQAVGVIFQGRDSHFDPDMVDCFIEIQDEFHAIAQRYPDSDDDMQKKIEYMANAIAEDADF